MQLTAGSRLGPYEVTGTLGAGGMGEVYRARDTRLDRDVAIKLLPDSFAADPDRVARFEREAKTLASLNHPGIAQVHGIESVAGSSPALVMELVEGEDLSQRLARGALPLPEALAIARQLAEALETAHDRGIIHRDLKPANIKVNADGAVKLLDFGLAKAIEGSDMEINARNSPTISLAATRAGLILGTAAYMAPEQARGQSVDRRADIWAFGVILFEMLTGRQVFAGDTISDVLASVLKNDLDWTTLPTDLPPPIMTLLQRCLQPDRKIRLRDIGEARIAIDDYLAHPTPPATTAIVAQPKGRWWWSTAALGITAVGLLIAVVALALRPRTAETTSTRTAIAPPTGVSVNIANYPSVAIAPDGWTVALVGVDRGDRAIFLRGPGDFDPRKLAGTEGGASPVFSPSGRSLAFHTPTQLKVMPVDGTPVVVAPVNDPRGLAWIDETHLVVSTQSVSGLTEFDLNGGAPRELTTPDVKTERTHRWPHPLPGGRWVLFTVGTVSSPDSYEDSDIDAIDRTNGERRKVYKGASSARYSPTGHLLLTRAGSLVAVKFDPTTLKVSGTPTGVLQGVGGDPTTGAVHADLSAAGTLAFTPSDQLGGHRQLMWVDQKGLRQSVPLPPALFSDVRLSPDATRVAVLDSSSGSADVWVYSVARGTYTRLTFTGRNATPVWSRDGREIYFAEIEVRGSSRILKVSADGGSEPVLVASANRPRRVYLMNISRDGTWALVTYVAFGGSRANVGRLPLAVNAELQPLVETPADEFAAALSPDERYFAYESDEANRSEVYVREVGASGGRWQVSNAGGEEPSWSRDGKTLFYRYEGRFMRVPVEAGPPFQFGLPTQLFDGVLNLRSDTGISYDVHPKGDRFLMIQSADVASRGSVRLITHWSDQLRTIK